MKIALGADHRGFKAKEHLKKFLLELGHTAEDFGSFSEDSVDYPDFAEKVGRSVAGGEFERGIVICDTGIGVCISANKIPKIRAALCWNEKTARMSRAHNDANVLCLAASFTEPELMERIVETWLSTAFEGGRHARRVGKIKALEEKPN